MLEIKPIQNKDEQEKICRLCNMEYDADTMAYVAYCDGKLAGIAQFGIHGKSGYLYDIRNAYGVDNTEALFIMGRAVLNFIDMHGVHEAFFENSSYPDEKLVAKIGFRKNSDGRFYVDLAHFFESPCQHNN